MGYSSNSNGGNFHIFPVFFSMDEIMDEIIIFPINMVDFPYKNGGLIWFHAICGYKFQWIIMDYHHFP